MFVELALLALGLLLLWKGSDITVDASKKIARKFSISHAVIGLTLISIGTSLPEIVTNVYVGMRIRGGAEVDGIAVGVILGSQITQITIILGAAALIGTMYAKKHTFKREVPMLFVALGGLFLAASDGFVAPWEALLLIIGYFIYLGIVNIQHDVTGGIINEVKKKNHREINAKVQIGIVVVGLAILAFGGKLVVDSAEILAAEFGVSHSLIGILVIGPGAALPELTVAINSMKKKASGISLGALLGSNITDPMFSFGVGAILAGYTIETELLWFDIPFWFMATCVAVGLMWKRRRIGKRDKKEGGILIFLFATYVILKLIFFL